ncbi:MAG TPA: hypothetical protein DCS89_16900 [Gammaproteobacteria bacterium]|jgi:LysR family glycine cleavage system transcriptional activator|nr:hypothetical protein [Gammaproteobacteria bacterium]HAT28697.1 hypothetical protein [Gammaproteobacteria bacterium]HIF88185.1 LysR family transcriptional regulator [Gammaproteobacteria bacterium]HIL22705.1 LysR family transcriptional regulator [Alcanivorax sp.]
MQNLRAKLPPLNSLIAFDTVARHLSFTKAGEELCCSREAVSRQIRVLEDHLGIKVFNRHHRAVSLTEGGIKLQNVVHHSLTDIADIAAILRKDSDPHKLTVSTTVAVSSFWLAPRLSKFQSLNPDVEIRVIVSDSPPEMLRGEIDIGLRYGNGHWPGLEAQHLFDTDSIPVCSPAYLERHDRIDSPEDLLKHQLINLDGTQHAMEDWTWWLSGNGVHLPDGFHTLGFDNYTNVIQLALDGQGIALGFRGLISDFLETGQLVQAIDYSLCINQSVYLVTPAAVSHSEEMIKFIRWISAEAKATSL